MKSKRAFPIRLFSLAVITIILCGGWVGDGQARALQDSTITLSITASPMEYSQVGDLITYTYVVRNNMSDTIRSLYFEDTLIDVACLQAWIGPGGTTTCTGTYVITQADVDNGEVTNVAQVIGDYTSTEGCGCTTEHIARSARVSFTISVAPQPSIALTKTGAPESFLGPGEEITYTYLVENTGNVTFEGPIAITDDMVPVYCPDGALEPGATLTCTASYTTTAADVSAGAIRNTAVANASETVTASDDFEVVFVEAPGLTLEKSANPSVYSHYWQLIKYSFHVTNTGNVPIDGPFQVQDELLDEWNCPEVDALAPGELLTCMGYYRVRQPGAPISNCASVEGVFRGDNFYSNQSCAEIPFLPPPAATEDPCDPDC